MEIHERNVVIKCHEFHICPECKRKLVEAVFGNNKNNIRK